jgi:hypothetical protein
MCRLEPPDLPLLALHLQIAAGALRYQPRRPAGTISTKGNGV